MLFKVSNLKVYDEDYPEKIWKCSSTCFYAIYLALKFCPQRYDIFKTLDLRPRKYSVSHNICLDRKLHVLTYPNNQ